MFGARLRTLAECHYADTVRTVARSTVSRLRVEARVPVTNYHTKPAQVELTRELIHVKPLMAAALSTRSPFLSPMRAPIVGMRLYATDNERRPSSTEQAGTKSQSVLTRLLEEEQQQPKALTVGERGVFCYGNQSLTTMFFIQLFKRGRILPTSSSFA